MNKKILILLLVTGVIFSIYARGLAQDIAGVGNSPIRMPASYTLDDSDKINANANLELREKNFSLTDLFSTFKKVFFGIISALGIEV